MERKARMEPLNVFEYERLAKKHMTPASWDFYGGGSDDEVMLATNQVAFAHIRLRSHPLVDVTQCDTSTSVLRTPVQIPILVAPTPLHGLVHPEGECATAWGAEAAGTLMIASTHSTRSLEEIAQAANGPRWFHLSIFNGYSDVEGILLRRAYHAGCQAIVVDVSVMDNRVRRKQDVTPLLPPPLVEANLMGFAQEELRQRSVNWDILDWIDLESGLPVLVRGILTVEEALLACEHYANGIIVSNHGSRPLDRAVTGIEALPEIVDAVAGRCEIYLDGSMRCGTDILKALALGARAVLVGRPVLWGLSVDGAHGVQRVLEILHTELELAMKLAGCSTLASINRTLVK